MSDLRRTPLHAFHVAHGGRMVEFAGWEMPVQYRSILEEHRAVRRAAGLFDVSHMGEIEVQGPQARAFLDRLVTNDITRLFPGRVLYSPACYPSGGVVDDLLVYQRGEDEYLLCVNAGNIARDFAWFQEQAAGWDVALRDRSDEYALLAVQGPRAPALVQSLTGAKLELVKYYHFLEATVAGVHCLVSRTGYTGEDGFELYHAADDAPALAEALWTAGQSHGLELAGLGARDSLRLEAGLPLYGHELSADISPLTAGLRWTVKFDKAADFIGKDALWAEKQAGSARRVVFFKTGDRRIVRPGTPVSGASGAPVGQVLSGTLSPVLNEAIGSALVETAALTDPLTAEVRGAHLSLQVVKPPFIELHRTS